MNKKLLSVACAVVLSVSLTACSGSEFMSEMTGMKNKWVDSDMIGKTPADVEFSVKDDFAAAVNQSWKNEIGDKYRGTFQDVTDAVLANEERMATDESIPGETAQRLRTYYGLASNWEDRAQDGVEPLRPYIEDIQSIGSMDEMYQFISDPERNPLFLGPITADTESVLHSEKYKENYFIFFTTPDMTLSVPGSNQSYFNLDGSSDLEMYEQVCDKATYILGKLGYSDDEAMKQVEGCVAWEKKLAGAENLTAIESIDDITYSRDEALKLTGDFPMEQILTGWGLNEAPYIAINPAYAKKLDSLCKEGNLENIKSFMIVNYCLKSSSFMDRETYDQMIELSKSKKKEEEDLGQTEEQKEDYLMFGQYIAGTPMVGAMNQVYVENCFDDSTLDELTTITENLIDGFNEIFDSEPWLSDEGKKACKEKLAAINIHIAYQNFDSVDYSQMDIKSHEEGGSFLEAYFESRRFEMDHVGWLANESYDRDYWDPLNQQLSTTITNAMYSGQTNSIYIFAGILEAPVYSKDMTYEEKLAGLFTIVGHEITHGFDKDGSQYDKDGYNNPILSDDDLKEFNDRNAMVGNYYTTQSPFTGCGMIMGPTLAGEATADMGGIKATLTLAEKENNFDYDTYFRAYARMWRTNVTLEAEKNSVKNDVHPLAFYRINIGLQQFDEFYETYGITEGDGMYVSPQRRIKVW